MKPAELARQDVVLSPCAGSSPTIMSRAMTLLFAVTGGAAVSNLYWPQPLLAAIATDFGITPAAASILITVTQLGYACGVLLLVPLGDALNRRKLVPGVMLVSSIALLASANATGFSMLLACFSAIGLTTVAGPLLVSMGGDLAEDSNRGRIVGAIVSGVLTGILLSRTVSGFVSSAFGWRAIYYVAAAVTLLLAAVLAIRLPDDRPRKALPYGRLLLSIAGAVGRHGAIPFTLALGACSMCLFSLFWTSLTFLLASPPFSYSVAHIGMVGIVGLAGAVAAQRAGRLHDAGWSVPATGIAILVMLAAIGIAAVGSRSIVSICAAVLLIDAAIQSANVLNQTRLLSVEPASRSRLTTAFVVCNFVGAALGSAIGGLLWQHGGWSAVTGGGAVVALLALLCWTVGRGPLARADDARAVD